MSTERPVHCHFCRQPMYYSEDPRHVPEASVKLTSGLSEDRSFFFVHLSCWNERMGSDTPNKEQLAILDVINALRSVVVFLHSNGRWSTGEHALSTSDSTDLINLLADAEAKLKLP